MAFSVSKEEQFFRIFYGEKQIVVRKAHKTKLLCLSRYAKATGHPGGRRLYRFLRRFLHRLSMSVDCYAKARNCATCAGNCVWLPSRNQRMKNFSALTPLEFAATVVLGEVVETPKRSKCLLFL